MANDTIPDRKNGLIITSEWFNVFKRALTLDFIPRNSSGEGSDLSQTLGSTSYGWTNLFTGLLSLRSGSNTASLKASAGMTGSFTSKLPASFPAGKSNLKIDATGQMFTEGHNFALSPGSGSFSAASTTDIAVTGVSVNLTVSGAAPVEICLLPDGTLATTITSVPGIGCFSGDAGSVAQQEVVLSIYKNGSLLGSCSGYFLSGNQEAWPARLVLWDFPAAGTHTYDLRVRNTTTGLASRVKNVMIMAQERFG